MEEGNFLKMLTKNDAELPTTVEDCHRLIRELLNLLKVVPELYKRVEKLEHENRALKERLNSNSSNSSLPPSKDLKKKPRNKKPASRRTSGGQPGHPGHFRQLLPSNEVSSVVLCPLPLECSCGGEIVTKEDCQRHQVYELPEMKLQITEYQLAKGHCLTCGKNHVADLPSGVPWGITGPRLTSFMSHLVSQYGLSRRELKEFLAEQLHFKFSLGSVFNKQKIVTKALETPVAALLDAIKQSSAVNMDETGHNRDGKRQWMWGVMSQTAAFFAILNSRGKKALYSLMGDFNNVVISDRYSAYTLFDSDNRQLCWAHLKRDFTRLSEKDDKIIRQLGKNLLACEAELFTLWHAFKRGHLPRDHLLKQAIPIRKRVGDYLEQGSYTDPALKAARFCKNLLTSFNALWTFLESEGVEPTNNHGERCLRPSVIWRKKYFCTRSDYGSEFVARTASTTMTCKLQSKSAFEFLFKTMQSYFAPEANIAPSLV